MAVATLAAIPALAVACAGAPAGDGGAGLQNEDVVGRWVPVAAYETDPFLELVDDGTWTGSDGCNGLSGRWQLEESGAVEASSGAQTLIGCEGENLGSLLVNATRLAVDGEQLTFYDEDEVIGEAVRG